MRATARGGGFGRAGRVPGARVSARAARPPGPSTVTSGAGPVVLALYLLHGLFWLVSQRLNEDEGWYLEAGRRVFAGQLPYRDFAFTQMPLAAYFYGLPSHLIGGGLWTGRATALLLGGALLALAMATAARLAGRGAALATGLLLATNAYAVAYLTLVKTYAPAALLLMAAARAYVAAPAARWRPYATLLLASAATLTRLSLLPALPILAAALLLETGARRRRGDILLALALAAGLLALPALPDPAAFRFGALEYPLVNQARYHLARPDLAGGATPFAAAWAFGAVKLPLLGEIWGRWGAAPPLLLAGGVLARRRRAGRRETALALVLGGGLLVQLLGAPYAEYAVPFAPLACLLAGVTLARAGRALPRATRAAWRIPAIAGLVIAGLATVDAGKLVPGVASPPRQLDRAAALVRANVPPGMPLFTFDTYLAIQADRPVPTALAMSHYSYYRSLPDDEATRYRVLNDAALRRLLREGGVGALAMTDTTYTILAPAAPGEPEIRALIEGRYRLVATVPLFGQWGDTLYLYLARQP
jgi:hypothetical protein